MLTVDNRAGRINNSDGGSTTLLTYAAAITGSKGLDADNLHIFLAWPVSDFERRLPMQIRVNTKSAKTYVVRRVASRRNDCTKPNTDGYIYLALRLRPTFQISGYARSTTARA